MKLTKPQELIWDMERFAAGSVCVICTSILRAGTQDPSILQDAANKLFLYNDALRTRIRREESGVSQYVLENAEQDVEVLHFANEPELEAYAQAYSRKAMDLSGPLCEIKALILPEQYGLLVKIHHLIADAWTMALLATQFNMLMEGQIPRCGSYQSYCGKEAAYRSSPRYQKDRAFFADLLRQQREPLFIRDQSVGTLQSERQVFVVPAQAAAAIRNFSDQENCSVFSLFATALAVYLSRLHGNQERFYIGTTVLNRMNPQEQNTAGMFVNTVPMLLTAKAEATFLNNLEQNEDMLMSVFRHQRYNYRELLSDTQKEPGFSGRLFDVMLNYMNAAVAGTNQKTRSVWYHNGMQNESLQIHLDDRDSEGIFRISYDYQTGKFSAEDVTRLHRHIMNLLFDGISHPEKQVCRLNMLSPAEEQKLRVGFNDTAKTHPIPRGSTIYSLFENNVKRNPRKTCLAVGGDSVSYQELLTLSERVDGAVRGHTHNEKSVIAVIAERSVEMYCAVYGIIRGGNAYLPILPDTPRERIDYMLKNSHAACVVAQEQFVDLAGDTACVNLTEIVKKPPQTENAPPCAATQDDVAYVIYTSGSTGMPKGVKISHRSVINRILWMNRAYPLGQDDVILQKTPYTFDVSVWEIFWWGMCGGSMAASKPAEHFLPAKILEAVHRHKVTHLHFVPSVLDVFLRYLENHQQERQKFCTVRHVFASGEALDAALVRRFYALFDPERISLHNLYGPTECTVDVTWYDCLPTDTVVPIGMPIDNTQIYITDSHLNLLPVGMKGELLIGGQNVGQGYLNAPSLTGERFVENPFGGGTLYKTGDLAYRREDGQLMFCGRMDAQVKINGQRVEIGEIEAAIKRVPGVEAAAVMMRPVGESNTLVAYYCAEEPLETQIQAMCEKRLPGYMIPKVLRRIDRIPLLPNGKCNRKELAAYEVMVPAADSAEPPMDNLEARLCEVFQTVLGQERVGRNSDFFALGGTSLSMISFFTQFGHEQITPADFIRNATPARLAAFLKNKKSDNMRYVETLYSSETGSRVYLFFPFAGGNAQAYAGLVNAMKRLDGNSSLYFVGYLHSDQACEKAAEEILSRFGACEVYCYSHCAGSAVALKILQYLQDRKPDLVKHYFAAASIPIRAVGRRNLWNDIPDAAVKGILRKAGAPEEMFAENNAGALLRRFREDTDYATAFFSRKQKKIRCPMSVIVGKKDLFTRFFLRPASRWKRYAHSIENVHCIPTSNHYFLSAYSEQLAKMILRFSTV